MRWPLTKSIVLVREVHFKAKLPLCVLDLFMLLSLCIISFILHVIHFFTLQKSKITSAVAPMTTTPLHQAAIQWQDCGMCTAGVIEEFNVKAELHDRSA